MNFIPSKPIALCSLLAVGATQYASAQSQDSRLERLEKAVQTLQQENDSLKKELGSLKAASSKSSVESVLNPTNRSPFAITLGKESKLKLGGFIQAHAEFGDPGSSDGNFSDNRLTPGRSVTRDRFRLRRARINVSGEFFEDFDFKLEGDFENGDGLTTGRTGMSGTDLFANWHRYTEAQIKVGQFKSPFGLEHLTSDTGLYIPERSLPTTALTQDRQLGVALWGKPLANVVSKDHQDIIDYQVGVFNGNARNTTINDDDNFMYAGRVGVTPVKTKVGDNTLSMKFGANAYTSRFGAGTRVSPSGNLRESLVDGALSGFSPTGASRATGWGIDQWFTFGPFDLVAEYLEAKYQPRGNTSFSEFTANGYYVQPSYFLPVLGGKRVQVVARWESFNPGQAADDNIKSIVGGVNYLINGDSIKLMLNYIHTWSDFRESRAGAGDDEFNTLLARVQLMF